VCRIPPEQVVGSASGTKFGYSKDGKPFLTKEPKLLLNDDKAGKPEGIHLMSQFAGYSVGSPDRSTNVPGRVMTTARNGAPLID
jgi:hypothetical protein